MTCSNTVGVGDSFTKDISNEFIGAYAEWINHHPVALRDVMPLLLMGLDCAEVATSATMALKDLTRDCQPSIAPFCTSILLAAKVHNYFVTIGFLSGNTL